MHPLFVLAIGLLTAWAATLLWRDGWAAPFVRYAGLLLAGGIVALVLGLGAVTLGGG